MEGQCRETIRDNRIVCKKWLASSEHLRRKCYNSTDISIKVKYHRHTKKYVIYNSPYLIKKMVDYSKEVILKENRRRSNTKLRLEKTNKFNGISLSHSQANAFFQRIYKI